MTELEKWCHSCMNLYGSDRHWSCFKQHKLNDNLSRPSNCVSDYVRYP